MGGRSILRQISYPAACFVLALAAVLGMASYLYYANAMEQRKRLTFDQLTAVAELKTDEISRWRNERLADAQIIMDTPFIARLVQQCFTRPDDPQSVAAVLKWMTTYKDRFDYYSVSLLNADGKVRYSLPQGETVTGHIPSMVAEAIHVKKPILGDIESTQSDPRVHLDLVAPVLNADEAGGAAVGAVLIKIDPSKFLYPLIQSWPTSSSTAETVLVRREGDGVVFLSALRHGEKITLFSRFLSEYPNAPCAMVAGGREGILDGVDHAGTPALSAVKRVRDTPWFLIAKLNTEEVYAPVGHRLVLVVTAAGLLLAGSVVTLLLIASQHRSKIFKEAYSGLEQRVRERTAELQNLNNQLTHEMERRTEAEKEFRSVAGRLAEMEESERTRVARVLHDSVGQSLTALSFSVTAALNRLSGDGSQEVRGRLEDSLKLVSDTMSRVRDVMADLRPPLLDDHGLVPVLRWYCREFSERSGTAAIVKSNGEVPRLPSSAEIALFRIAEEALTNVMRHARASEVTVELLATAEAVRMSIADNGVGFSQETESSLPATRSKWGMLSMRERAEMVGGRFQVQSSPGGGTRITVELNCPVASSGGSSVQNPESRSQ